MRKQFFGNKGLTSTSANYTANMCKEFIQTQKAFLDKLCFVNTTTETNGKSFSTGIATPAEQFAAIDKVIKKIALATQLDAWLREGIKEKKHAGDNIPNIDEWLKSNGRVRPVSPHREEPITELDVTNTWDENKYNAYITAQTYATVYGEVVHPNRPFSDARKVLTDSLSTPHKVDGNGRDITVITYTPAYTVAEVDSKFFELQGKQREYQAKYNQYRHEITDKIEDDVAKKDAAYMKAYEEYRKEDNAIYAEYTQWRNKTSREIADLKIVIPEALAGIYEEISGLGK